MLALLAHAWAFTCSHPEIYIPLVLAVFNAICKPRTPEQYNAMPKPLAQTLRFIAALSPDPVKALKIFLDVIGRIPPATGGLVLVMLCAACSPAMKSEIAKDLYDATLKACVRDFPNSRAAARACVEERRAAWSDAGAPTASFTLPDAGATDSSMAVDPRSLSQAPLMKPAPADASAPADAGAE